METLVADGTVFVTLTYNQKYYPESGNVCKREIQLFMKRLRKLYGYDLRYYACGEYGMNTDRAHYHLVIFGMYLDQADLIKQAWTFQGEPLGFVEVSEITPARAAYAAKHNTRIMTQEDLKGRDPQFALMSKQPGIGAIGTQNIIDAVKHSHIELIDSDGNLLREKIPTMIRFQGAVYPLDNYMRGKIQKALGDYDSNSLPNLLKGHVKDIHDVLFDPETGEILRDQAKVKIRRSQKKKGDL